MNQVWEIFSEHLHFLAASFQAGICDSVVEYPYSTLPGLLGRGRRLIPVVEDSTLFSDVEGTLAWLDRKPKDEDWEAVRKALRKKEFGFPKIDSRPHPLEIDML